MLLKQHRKELTFLSTKLFTPGFLEGLARRTGFMQRAGKIPVEAFVNALMIPEQTCADTSLVDIAALIRQSNNIDISKVALHQKFNANSVFFLESLLKYILLQKLKQSSRLKLSSAFEKIIVKDSTKFSISDNYDGYYKGFGNFSKTNGLLSIQYEYDLISGDWLSLRITPGLKNDQSESSTSIADIRSGELHIRDLGYAVPTYFRAIIEKSAYFLSRLPTQAGLYKSNGSVLTWQELDSKMKKANYRLTTMDVLLYERNKITVRLIIESVDDNEYNRRLEKAVAKSKNVGISKEHRIRLRYTLIITNTSAKQIPAEIVRKVYYLRWQIELVFKTSKSFYRINRVKKMARARFETQLLARLLWILINWHIFKTLNRHVKKLNKSCGISIIKFFKPAMQFASTLKLVLHRKYPATLWLTDIYLPLIRDCLCEAPKNKSTHYQTLNFNFVS